MTLAVPINTWKAMINDVLKPSEQVGRQRDGIKRSEGRN